MTMRLSKIAMSKTTLDPETFLVSKQIVINLDPEAFTEAKASMGVDETITVLVKEYEKFLRDTRAEAVKQLKPV
jgi:hypothetical protein